MLSGRPGATPNFLVVVVVVVVVVVCVCVCVRACLFFCARKRAGACRCVGACSRARSGARITNALVVVVVVGAGGDLTGWRGGVCVCFCVREHM